MGSYFLQVRGRPRRAASADGCRAGSQYRPRALHSATSAADFVFIRRAHTTACRNARGLKNRSGMPAIDFTDRKPTPHSCNPRIDRFYE